MFEANDVITRVQMLTYINVPGCFVHWARRQIKRIQSTELLDINSTGFFIDPKKSVFK